MGLPKLLGTGELPPGVHRATLQETVGLFGAGTPRRVAVGKRLERIYRLARATAKVARFIVFGSFVTAKPEPNDVDVFMIMEDDFRSDQLAGEVRTLFDHASAQAQFGASVFWLRRLAALGGEDEAVAHWQTKREPGLRGIVEIIGE